MDEHHLLYYANILVSFLGTFITLALIGLVYRYRSEYAARWFIALLLCVVWVNFWYVLEGLAAADLNAYVSFSKIEYFGLTFIPLTWFGFGYAFNGSGRSLSTRIVLLLAVIPMLTIALALTNEYHGLIWRVPRFDHSTFPPTYEPDYGTGFWVFVVYAYCLFLAGTVLLLNLSRRTWATQRAQAVSIVLGVLIPWVNNLLEIFNLTLIPGLNTNALSLALGAMCLAAALLRLKLFELPVLTYSVLIENVPDALIVIDHAERLVAFNPAAQKYAQTSLQRGIGKSMAVLFCDLYAQLKSVSVSGHVEIMFAQRWLEVRRRTIADSRNIVRGYLFIISDVTEREQYLQQGMLLMREQERVQALRRLIAIVSHDFRTPLSVIGTSAYLLQRSHDEAQREQHYTAITAQIKAFDTMLTKMLDMTHLMGEDAVLEPTIIAPNVLVRIALEHNQSILFAHAPGLITNLAPDLPNIRVDDAALVSALGELLQNAVEHTPPDGTISIFTRREGEGVVFEVRDTGCGIEAEHLPHIFEEFYRVDQARTLSKGGSGLGLALVRRIIEMSGGHVSVESTPNVGSSFCIWLPSAEDCAMASGEADAAAVRQDSAYRSQPSAE